MKTSLILLAYAFPPEHLVGAARPYRFYRYLPEFGVNPIVITATPQPEKLAGVHFVRDVPRDQPRKTWSWQVERVIRKFFLPGQDGIAWSREAAKQAVQLAPPGGRTVVLSTSPPISVHLAAMQIRKRLGIPWVADFRDPITNTARVKGGDLGIRSVMESLFLNRADAIIANTDVVHDILRARYPKRRDRIHFIWNGFDPADKISPPPLPARSVRHLVHMGEIYAGRHPGVILDSIERLTSNGTLSADAVRLSLMGRVSDDSIPNPDVLQRLVASGIVEYDPTLIPQDRARAIAFGADALVLLHHSGLQVPAKLYEYIRIGRPVLAYVTPGSPSERILAGSGVRFRAIYPDDPPAEVDAKLLDFLTLANDRASPSEWFQETFDGRQQTRLLASLVESLASGRNAR